MVHSYPVQVEVGMSAHHISLQGREKIEFEERLRHGQASHKEEEHMIDAKAASQIRDGKRPASIHTCNAAVEGDALCRRLSLGLAEVAARGPVSSSEDISPGRDPVRDGKLDAQANSTIRPVASVSSGSQKGLVVAEVSPSVAVELTSSAGATTPTAISTVTPTVTPTTTSTATSISSTTTPRQSAIDPNSSDSIPDEELLSRSIALPGSRNKKIWFLLPVCSGRWTSVDYDARFRYVVIELKRAVDGHNQLRDRARFIDYDLRMVGPQLDTARPSILVKCQRNDLSSLKSLFKKAASSRLYCYSESSFLSRLSMESAPPPKPAFRLFYYASDANPTLRRAGEIVKVVSVQSSSTLCGALIEFEGRQATIGLTLDIDGDIRALTVDHLFQNDTLDQEARGLSEAQTGASGSSESSSAEDDLDDTWYNDSDDDDESASNASGLDSDDNDDEYGGSEEPCAVFPDDPSPLRLDPSADTTSGLKPHQWLFLLSKFLKEPNPDPASVVRLAKEMPSLSTQQINAWFENRRSKIQHLNEQGRDRVIEMRAVLEDLDNTRALHSHTHGPATLRQFRDEDRSRSGLPFTSAYRIDMPRGILKSQPYLDWACLALKTNVPMGGQCNMLIRDGEAPVTLEHVAQDPRVHGAPVYLVSGRLGVRPGRLLGSIAYIGSQAGQKLCESWTVILDSPQGIVSGECGSIVVDQQTMEVYGHLIGSDVFGHGRVVPLRLTIAQIGVLLDAKRITLLTGGEQAFRKTTKLEPRKLHPQPLSMMSSALPARVDQWSSTSDFISKSPPSTSTKTAQTDIQIAQSPVFAGVATPEELFEELFLAPLRSPTPEVQCQVRVSRRLGSDNREIRICIERLEVSGHKIYDILDIDLTSAIVSPRYALSTSEAKEHLITIKNHKRSIDLPFVGLKDMFKFQTALTGFKAWNSYCDFDVLVSFVHAGLKEPIIGKGCLQLWIPKSLDGVPVEDQGFALRTGAEGWTTSTSTATSPPNLPYHGQRHDSWRENYGGIQPRLPPRLPRWEALSPAGSADNSLQVRLPPRPPRWEEPSPPGSVDNSWQGRQAPRPAHYLPTPPSFHTSSRPNRSSANPLPTPPSIVVSSASYSRTPAPAGLRPLEMTRSKKLEIISNPNFQLAENGQSLDDGRYPLRPRLVLFTRDAGNGPASGQLSVVSIILDDHTAINPLRCNCSRAGKDGESCRIMSLEQRKGSSDLEARRQVVKNEGEINLVSLAASHSSASVPSQHSASSSSAPSSQNSEGDSWPGLRRLSIMFSTPEARHRFGGTPSACYCTVRTATQLKECLRQGHQGHFGEVQQFHRMQVNNSRGNDLQKEQGREVSGTLI